MSAWERSVAMMVAQGGLARRDALVEMGVSAPTVRRRVLTGLLVPVNRHVVALPGIELDLATRSRAAVMARPDTIPTGLSSAALLGDGPWQEVPLQGDPWLVGRADRALAARFVSHPGLGTVKRSGLIIADPASTLVDLLRFLDLSAAVRVGRSAVQQRVLSVDQLIVIHARLTGLRGVRQLHTVITELVEGTHSEAEHELVSIVRRAGLTGWRPNFFVRIAGRRYFIDLAFRMRAWLWRSTVALTTATRAPSDGTGSDRTTSWRQAGRCCASPGRTSCRIRPASSPESSTLWSVPRSADR